jgi:predicted DNA-binding transcriptional regulator AlpA
MTKWLRFRDLKERKTFNSRMTLKRAIDRGEFPPGCLITPNSRAWTEEEAETYESTRPIARKTIELGSKIEEHYRAMSLAYAKARRHA